jgi:hypothetical protein
VSLAVFYVLLHETRLGSFFKKKGEFLHGVYFNFYKVQSNQQRKWGL